MGAYRIGIDENGLGARLGPLLVTGVLAEVDERGERLLRRKLPAKLRADLDDSKRLVSCHDVTLGEAWARAVAAQAQLAPGAPRAASPLELFEQLSLEGAAQLKLPCPRKAKAQCWNTEREEFLAEPDLLARIEGHVALLAARGVRIAAVRSATVCVGELNRLKAAGVNRFSADLHAMERLVIELQRRAGGQVVATLGKVGGINEYTRFWGPLAGRLHNVLEEGRPRSSYRFPDLGELHFVRDADASDPLVMLASLVGKYFRELLMRRIARHWSNSDAAYPSGYHDPVTERFVQATSLARKKQALPLSCFERTLDPKPPATSRAHVAVGGGEQSQTSLFDAPPPGAHQR